MSRAVILRSAEEIPHQPTGSPEIPAHRPGIRGWHITRSSHHTHHQVGRCALQRGVTSSRTSPPTPGSFPAPWGSSGKPVVSHPAFCFVGCRAGVWGADPAMPGWDDGGIVRMARTADVLLYPVISNAPLITVVRSRSPEEPEMLHSLTPCISHIRWSR